MAEGEIRPGQSTRPGAEDRAGVIVGGLHPVAARLVEQVSRSGEFTAETWREISQVMDDLSDVDLRAILEAVGATARGRASLSPSKSPPDPPLRPRGD